MSVSGYRDRVLVLSAVAVLSLALGVESARAQRAEPLPKELENVGVTEHPGAQVPLDLQFVDENGKPVRLGDYIDGTKPVILNLVYYKCPMLCGLVMQGIVDGVSELKWTAGDQFEIVTVSFNPAEGPTLARLKKQTFMKQYARPGADQGWHFLTGTEENIKRLTDAVGFQYHWNEETQQFVHSAAIFVLTPKGKVARYLYGVVYEPQTLKLALTEAGQGTVGGTADRILLYCFHYDPNQGRYVVGATNVMKLGGVATVLIVGVWLGTAWLRGGRSRKRAAGREEP